MVRLGETFSVSILLDDHDAHPLFMSISAHAAVRNAIAPGERIGVSLRADDIHIMPRLPAHHDDDL